MINSLECNLKSLLVCYFSLRNLLIYTIFFTICIILISYLGPQIYAEPIGLEISSLILNNKALDSINPHFSVSNNSIYAVWISNLNSKNSEVMFKKIDENSNSLSSTVNISNTSGTSNLVKLSSSEDNAYITWEDKQTDKWKLLFSKSDNKGRGFGTVTNLSNDTGNVHLHDQASVKNNVYVLWAANENISSSNKEIFFRASHDGGNSFSDAVNLSNDNDDSLDPHMVINQNGSIIYIVWTKCDTEHDDPECSIDFTRSFDYGNTFSTSKIVNTVKFLPQGTKNNSSNNTAFSSNSNMIPAHLSNDSTTNERISSINPIVFTAMAGKQVYVLWEQSTFGKGDSEILLTSSMDYGNSFNSTINISNSFGTSRSAHGQIMGEELYVTWADTLNQTGTFDVLLRKIDARNQLGKVVNLSNNSDNSVSPFIWMSNNRIYVTWSDITNDSSVLLSTIDPSRSTIAKQIVKSNQMDVYANPMIFETENKLWIAWTESRNDFNNIVLWNQEKP